MDSGMLRLFLVLVGSSIIAGQEGSGPSHLYRLPKKIVPGSYDLQIKTHLDVGRFIYDGDVAINLHVIEKTNVVIVHSDELIIHENKTQVFPTPGGPGKLLDIYSQDYDVDRHFFIVTLDRNLEIGEYTLKLSFAGEIRNDTLGFYRSLYEVEGKTRWVSLTQFSSTFARRAFPCMDEPELKAVFRISIVHPKKMTVTSNGSPERKTDIKNTDCALTIMKETPLMSTYLVGWVIHDFTPKEMSTSGVNLTIWTRKSVNQYAKYALEQAAEIYEILQSWVEAENPMKKFDMFAIPDFYFSGMENWGLINFAESIILVDRTVTSAKDEQHGLTVLAHELAHTWFGNLVTPKFWDVAWLKEGFSTYFAYLVLDMANTDWKIMDMFPVLELQPMLLQDSTDHARTLNAEGIGSRESINRAMDGVPYRKGASVLRMLSYAIGPNAFTSGVRSYLKIMAYQSVRPRNLYVHLQKAADEDRYSVLSKNVRIESVMDTWTNQKGYPVVTVSRNYSTWVARVSQEPFHLNPDTPSAKQDKSSWWIPLSYMTEDQAEFLPTRPRDWLRPQDKETLFGNIDPKKWILFNIDQSGYYRVNYDHTNWGMLINQLLSTNYTLVPLTSRAALLDDAFNLARAGRLEYSVPFNLSKYLIQEVEYEPWLAASRVMKFINLMLHGQPKTQREFQKMVIELLSPVYKNLTFDVAEAEERSKRLLREVILSTACEMGHSDCLKKSEEAFQKWIKDGDKGKLHPDLRSFAYCEGVRAGSKSNWENVWARFLRADLQTEQDVLLRALGCTKDPKLIERFLNSAVWGFEFAIRLKHRYKMFEHVLEGHPENVNHVLDYVDKNLRLILDNRGKDFFDKVFLAVGKRIVTQEQLNKLVRFLEKHGSEYEGSAFEEATENLKWIKENSPTFSALFADTSNNTSMPFLGIGTLLSMFLFHVLSYFFQ